MVNDIQITNMETGDTILLSKNGTSVFVLDSIDWDVPDVELNRYRVPLQIGYTTNNIMIRDRQPEIQGYIIADETIINANVWDEYYKEQEKQIVETKRKLNKIISPFQLCMIRVDGRYLIGRPKTSVKYGNTERENNEVLCKFDLQFVCDYPLFFGVTKVANLAVTKSRLHFPVVFAGKIPFGEITKKVNVEIVNDGDVKIGIKAKIRILGDMTSVKIVNITTQEFIGIKNITLRAGDYIELNTTQNEEYVLLYRMGEIEPISLVGNITKGSTFVQAEIGTNYFGYELSNGSNDVEISIEYSEKYFNIETM